MHLASASPRRRDILASLGLQFSAAGVDLDESRRAGENAADLVLRLAREKAAEAAQTVPAHAVLGSDTEVVLGERIFGKPASQEEACEMLLALSGRTHEVLTGIALLYGEHADVRLCRSEVRFRTISAAEAEAYWHSGEPRDKAGGYAIQGLASIFVEELRGSYSGVIGLPVYETTRMLEQIGIHVLST